MEKASKIKSRTSYNKKMPGQGARDSMKDGHLTLERTASLGYKQAIHPFMVATDCPFPLWAETLEN